MCIHGVVISALLSSCPDFKQQTTYICCVEHQVGIKLESVVDLILHYFTRQVAKTFSQEKSITLLIVFRLVMVTVTIHRDLLGLSRLVLYHLVRRKALRENK